MIKMFSIILLFIVGCSPTFSPDQVNQLAISMSNTCNYDSSISLPAPDGQSYKIPIPDQGRAAACQASQRYMYEMTRSGWERFGTTAFTTTMGAATTLGPYGALAFVASEGIKYAGDHATDSYNSETNPTQGDTISSGDTTTSGDVTGDNISSGDSAGNDLVGGDQNSNNPQTETQTETTTTTTVPEG